MSYVTSVACERLTVQSLLWTIKFAIINKSRGSYFHVFIVHILYFLNFEHAPGARTELKRLKQKGLWKNLLNIWGNVIFYEDVGWRPANWRFSSTSIPFILTPACQWFRKNFAERFSSHFKDYMAKTPIFYGSIFHTILQRLKNVINRDGFLG